MESDLKAGDNVTLKSDGPTMTIEGFEGTRTAICVWFNNNNEFNRQKVYTQALKKVS